MEILSTAKNKPPRLLIHGSHFSGKSSIGASAYSTLFMNIEQGLNEIEAQAMPTPATTSEIINQLRWFYKGEHDFKTLVVDSLDWMEAVINSTVLEENNLKTLVDKFAKGHKLAFQEFIKIKDALEAIHRDKNACIIVLCHSVVKEFKDPAGENYDRYGLKLRDAVSELFCEWADMVGFLHPEVEVDKESKKEGGFGKKNKAITSGRRLLSVNQNPAYRAGNRYGINKDIVIQGPSTGWSDIWAAIQEAKTQKGVII